MVAELDVPMPLAIVIGGVFTGIVGGVVIGVPAVRLSGPYLAIATFALVITLPQILKLEFLTDWTNGALGIRIDQLQPPGFVDRLDETQWLYYTMMATAVFLTILFWNITRSRFGRAFIALRDSEVGAEQMGVNVPFYKALAFGLSSLYAGIAGGMYFAVQGFVGPESLGFLDTILFLVAIVIGGLGTVLGSVIGGLFLTFQAEIIDKLSEWIPAVQDLRGVVYGGLLIVTMLLFPRGIAGGLQQLRPANIRQNVASIRQRLGGPAAVSTPPGPPARPPAGPADGGSSG
jgi:branched-chain amino acid transport system permease protein